VAISGFRAKEEKTPRTEEICFPPRGDTPLFKKAVLAYNSKRDTSKSVRTKFVFEREDGALGLIRRVAGSWKADRSKKESFERDSFKRRGEK